MTQKFMLIAVLGYVFFASIAAIAATGPANAFSRPRQFVIIFSQWCAVFVFAAASMTDVLETTWLTRSEASWTQYWPLPGLWLLVIATVVLLSPIRLSQLFRGWWSPLPWLQGLVAASVLGLWAGASQGPLHTIIPDWRFIGASTVLWLVCLLIGDVALLISNGEKPLDRISRIYQELLRLCSAAPAVLIYLIGFRL